MGWNIVRGHSYFVTRHRRPGGGWYSLYYGRGPLAEAAAERQRRAGEDRRVAWSRELERRAQVQRRHDQILADLDALTLPAIEAAESALREAGFRRHQRGEWRLRWEFHMKRCRNDGQPAPGAGEAVRLPTALDRAVADRMARTILADPDGEAGRAFLEILREDHMAVAEQVAGPEPDGLALRLAHSLAFAEATLRTVEFTASVKDGRQRLEMEKLIGPATARVCKLARTLATIRTLLSPPPYRAHVAREPLVANGSNGVRPVHLN